jgi:hypothetical protein
VWLEASGFIMLEGHVRMSLQEGYHVREEDVFPIMCNSITLDRPLAHTRARIRDPLHTSTTVTHKASLPIAPQKPRPLQSKGNYYFKVSEQVTSPIETLFSAHHR